MPRQPAVARPDDGIFDEQARAVAKPIGEHIAEYVQALRDRKNTPDHCKLTEFRVRYVCEHGDIQSIAQITRARVDAALATLSVATADRKALSASSRNHYLTAVKMFAQWLCDERRLSDNAIQGMRRKSTEGERVHERRPLTPVEFAKLLKSTAKASESLKLSGAERVALYRLAAATGFRRNELASITPKSFTFGGSPTITVQKGYSKRRRVDVLPLRADVAAEFARYVKGRPADVPLWGSIADANTAEMIRDDLERAKVKLPSEGETIDFHSLRQTFATDLARAGVAPKTLQQLARHSDINLTMKVYAKMTPDDERRAVESIGSKAGNLAHSLAHKDATHRTGRNSNGTAQGRKKSGDGRKKTPKTKANQQKKPR